MFKLIGFLLVLGCGLLLWASFETSKDVVELNKAQKIQQCIDITTILNTEVTAEKIERACIGLIEHNQKLGEL